MSEISMTSKNGFDYFKIQDPENSLQIKPYQAELENSRMGDLKSVNKSINEVRRDFETLKSEVCNLMENQSTEHLKKQMFNIEENITHLKEAMKEEMLILLKDEVNLAKDLQFLRKRINEWEKVISARIFKPVKLSKYKIMDTDDKDPTEVFRKFLSRSGGHSGGWEEQDHLLFLRERAKHKGKEKFILAVQYLLPDVTLEEIESHEKWYQKYELLRNSQKDAIQRWRLEKKTQEKRERKRKESKEEKNQVKRPVRQQINIAERIKEWKNQQRIRKLEEEDRQRKEKEKLKEEEKRKKELQEMKKLAVSQYKAEKLSKIQAIFPKSDNTVQAQKAKNKILLKAFRLQDLKFIEKKKIIRLQIESKLNEKLEKLKLEKPALEFILQRNPQRIFQPTFIWNQHCLEAQNREKTIPVFDLNSIPRLATPEWRRELK